MQFKIEGKQQFVDMYYLYFKVKIKYLVAFYNNI